MEPTFCGGLLVYVAALLVPMWRHGGYIKLEENIVIKSKDHFNKYVIKIIEKL